MKFFRTLLTLESFHAFLLKIDQDLLSEARQGRCPLCGGPLCRADFGRRPRGIRAGFEGLYAKRFGLCCGREGCRHRLTPFSIRFLGGMQHVAAVMVVVSAMLHGVSRRRAAQIRAQFGVSAAVAERWRGWWGQLPLGAFWKSVRGRLPPTFDGLGLPRSLLEAFGGEARERLVSLLRFLLPLTSGSAPGSQTF